MGQHTHRNTESTPLPAGKSNIGMTKEIRSPSVSSASFGGKNCGLSSSELGGVALRAELQPGFVGLAGGGWNVGMVGVGSGWTRGRCWGTKRSTRKSKQVRMWVR